MIPGLQDLSFIKLVTVKSATNNQVYTSHNLIPTLYCRDDPPGPTKPERMGILGGTVGPPRPCSPPPINSLKAPPIQLTPW